MTHEATQIAVATCNEQLQGPKYQCTSIPDKTDKTMQARQTINVLLQTYNQDWASTRMQAAVCCSPVAGVTPAEAAPVASGI